MTKNIIHYSKVKKLNICGFLSPDVNKGQGSRTQISLVFILLMLYGIDGIMTIVATKTLIQAWPRNSPQHFPS